MPHQLHQLHDRARVHLRILRPVDLDRFLGSSEGRGTCLLILSGDE